MHTCQLFFTYYVLIFIWIIICIIQTKFLFLFIIAIINRFFFHFVYILDYNDIEAEGAKVLGEALKLNKNLAYINLGKLLRLFQHIITDI